MSLRTHFRPHIIIAEAHGAIDAGNDERLSDDVDNLASPGRPLVLGLYWVDFFGGDGFRTLVRIAGKCKRKAVERLLRSIDSNCRLPTAASLEAVQRLTRLEDAWSVPQRITPPELTRC